MPPPGAGEALNSKQVVLLTAWIDAGAPFPKDESIPADPRQHWAYQVPRKPLLPRDDDRVEVGKDGKDGVHPIDALLKPVREQKGIHSARRANRATLLRRIYFDLIGLPPSPEELAAFEQDETPDAWERTVDRLLASPHYGERWGRHWMDIWRYSDWEGYKQQLRGSQRHIWHWRDWIVRSLNDDKGYDRMITEMLAGDELEPTNPEVLAATGFLARNYHSSNRNIWLDATVEHTAKALLGITLNCARCHDHKYDPIPQMDYYKFRAIFEPHQVRTDPLPGQVDLNRDGLPRVFDADLNAKTFLFVRGDEKRPAQEHPLEPAPPGFLGGSFLVQPVSLPVDAYYPALAHGVAADQLAALEVKRDAAQQDLDQATVRYAKDGPSKVSPDELRRLKQRLELAQLAVRSLAARQAADQAKYHAEDTEKAASLSPHNLAIQAAQLERRLNVCQAELAVAQRQAALQRAQADKPQNRSKQQSSVAAEQKMLAEAQQQLRNAQKRQQCTDGKYTPIGKQYPRSSTGRRLALARWITSRENPLTARVAVNHIWLRHFGTPLVENVFDFGLRSPRPMHADLLDWLAVELMENNWSMKHLHRLIVTSEAWQMASTASGPLAARNGQLDPDNLTMWRMNPRRLEAEIVRDNLLAVSGQLDKTLGGPVVDYQQGEVSRRRSLYLQHAYEKQATMLLQFDAPSPNECYRRSESVVPQQALTLLNSPLALDQSRLLAGQLRKQETQGQAPARWVRNAFLRVLSRPPSAAELADCLRFLTDQTTLLSDTADLTTFAAGPKARIQPATDATQQSLENLVHVLLNHNDFITIR